MVGDRLAVRPFLFGHCESWGSALKVVKRTATTAYDRLMTLQLCECCLFKQLFADALRLLARVFEVRPSGPRGHVEQLQHEGDLDSHKSHTCTFVSLVSVAMAFAHAAIATIRSFLVVDI